MNIQKKELKKFLKFVAERENIRKSRGNGNRPPWTKDPILQTYKFTNVHRLHDVVTIHYLDHVSPATTGRSVDWRALLYNTVFYRLVNWPATMRCIGFLKWDNHFRDRKKIAKIFEAREIAGLKNFTGAYLLGGTHLTGKPKWEMPLMACDSLVPLLEDSRIERLLMRGHGKNDKDFLQALHALLCKEIRGLGGFLAYEVVTDLTYTWLKENPGQYSWANAGPGAVRGLRRLCGMPVSGSLPKKDTLEGMREVMIAMRDEIPCSVDGGFTMRDAEHCLCEFDKYQRVLLNEGRPRAKYPCSTPEEFAAHKFRERLDENEEVAFRNSMKGWK